MLSKEITTILLTSNNIAVIGASRNSEKAANQVPKYLQSQGYKIYPVNPFAEKIIGEKSYPSLKEIPDQIDIVDIFRPAEEAPKIVKEAIKLKPKLIWLQLGIISEEAKKIVENSGIKFVMNKCMKIEHSKLMNKG